MQSALPGLKVLDLTSGIAGPFCAKIMAGLGAQVVKVERPWGGDPSRHIGPFLRDIPHCETSALFHDLNGGKRSVTLDIKSAAGAGIVRALAAWADILVESFRPGVMQRLGFGFERLRTLNPRLTVVSLSNFGQTGPYRDYLGFDMLFYGMGGEMYATGLPERTPIRLANYVTQYQAGSTAAAAGLMAWYGVRRGAPGQQVDLSIFESQAHSPERRIQYLLGYAYNRTVPARRDQVWAIYPTGIYPCKDGFLEIFGGGPQFFPRTCRMIGRPDLIQDKRFNSPQGLVDVERKDEFDTIFLPWVIERTRDECMAAAQRESVYAAPIFTPEDVYHDRHFKFRGFFVDVEHPAIGRVRVPGPPAKLTATPWQALRAPLLGEHTEAVLTGWLGYSKAELYHLRQAGAI